MKSRFAQLLAQVLPPAAVLLAVVAIWHLAVLLLEVPKYLAPSPQEVGRVFVQQAGMLAQATWISGQAALCGFAISLVLGCLTAIVFSQSSMIRRSLYPYAIFLQTVPIVAVAPLIINWCGPGLLGVVVVVTVISLFPIIASTTAGLTSVPAGLADLFRLHGAGRWQRLLKLQLPHAVPALLHGARASSGLAVVGSIVGEFFAGYGLDRHGLGNLITQAAGELRTDLLFATMILSAILGVMIFGSVSLCSSILLTRWFGGNTDPNA